MRSLYWAGTYCANNPTWHEEDSQWKAKQILRMLHRNELRPRVVAEIGCGAGGVLSNLYDLLVAGTVFRGYEPSPQAFKLCKGKAKERLEFNLGSLDGVNCEDVDLLLIIDVLEHVENCHEFLKELARKASFKILHIPLELT